MREFLTGNQAIVRGAVRAGCNFFAGYPITPASSIVTEFIDAFADGSGIVVQTEDEIAAIGQCIGAAMAGAKAMTASSGPGLSLYSENIGLAQMGEVPLVIVDCQRMGPATGGATATGDGDVLFAGHVTAGGYPLPVLAATDAETAFRLTYQAFNIAEELRTPVILLVSKDISLTRQTVNLHAIRLPPMQTRKSVPVEQAFRPYAFDRIDDVPGFSPIGGAKLARFTGSIHDERGILTIDRAKIERKLSHLRSKIVEHRLMLEITEEDVDPFAATLVISYGLVDGAARDAVDLARAQKVRVSRLTLYSLWPIPEAAIKRAVTSSVRTVLIPELNVGLYVEELRKVIHDAEIKSVLRYDGGLIHPRSIADAILESVSA
jgi:2-oxoglutarate ferredoxin oxidoreductase subunit alpha